MTIQDFKENYYHNYFNNENKTLLEIYFEHFITDLELQLGNNKEGMERVNELKEKLNTLVADMKKANEVLLLEPIA